MTKDEKREKIAEILERNGKNTSEDFIYWDTDEALENCISEILALFPKVMSEDEIFAFMKDHYWDSLEKDKGLIEEHCKFIAHALAGKIPKQELMSLDEIEQALIKANDEIPETAERYGDYFYRLAKALSGKIEKPKEENLEDILRKLVQFLYREGLLTEKEKPTTEPKAERCELSKRDKISKLIHDEQTDLCKHSNCDLLANKILEIIEPLPTPKEKAKIEPLTVYEHKHKDGGLFASQKLNEMWDKINEIIDRLNEGER